VSVSNLKYLSHSSNLLVFLPLLGVNVYYFCFVSMIKCFDKTIEMKTRSVIAMGQG
jgi:hypothetical protein